MTETNYLNPTPTRPQYIEETRKNEDFNKNYNGNLGIELFLNESTTWTNSINYRKSNEENQDNVNFDNQYTNASLNDTRTRISNQEGDDEAIEFKSSLQKKFKKEGHKLDVDVQISSSDENEISNILDSENGTDITLNNQKQNRCVNN